MANILITMILILIVGSAVRYIWKEKKKGNMCIGCSSGGCCSQACQGGCKGRNQE